MDTKEDLNKQNKALIELFNVSVDDYTNLRNQTSDLIDAVKEVLVISDRKHDAWDKVKKLIKEIEDSK